MGVGVPVGVCACLDSRRLLRWYFASSARWLSFWHSGEQKWRLPFCGLRHGLYVCPHQPHVATSRARYRCRQLCCQESIQRGPMPLVLGERVSRWNYWTTKCKTQLWSVGFPRHPRDHPGVKHPFRNRVRKAHALELDRGCCELATLLNAFRGRRPSPLGKFHLHILSILHACNFCPVFPPAFSLISQCSRNVERCCKLPDKESPSNQRFPVRALPFAHGDLAVTCPIGGIPGGLLSVVLPISRS